MIKVKPEYVIYAKRLDSIGDSIKDNTVFIKSQEELDKINSLNDYKNKINSSIEELKKNKQSLIEIKPPFIVQNQHQKYIEVFGKYVESIQILNNSFYYENEEVSFNKDDYNRGFSIHIETTKQLDAISKIIGDKLTKQ